MILATQLSRMSYQLQLLVKIMILMIMIISTDTQDPYQQTNTNSYHAPWQTVIILHTKLVQTARDLIQGLNLKMILRMRGIPRMKVPLLRSGKYQDSQPLDSQY